MLKEKKERLQIKPHELKSLHVCGGGNTTHNFTLWVDNPLDFGGGNTTHQANDKETPKKITLFQQNISCLNRHE